MVKKLPTFRGYTVDIRLKQFRKIDPKNNIDFIDFNTQEGDKLLNNYLNCLCSKIKKMEAIFKKIKDSFN